MQTTARCPVDKLGQTIAVLQQKGFKQTRVNTAVHRIRSAAASSVIRTASPAALRSADPPSLCIPSPVWLSAQNMLLARF